jgi:hypothetical protein
LDAMSEDKPRKLTPKSLNKRSILGSTIVITLVLVFALFAHLHVVENSSVDLAKPVPFDYTLSVSPSNGTVQQGKGF